MRIISLFCPALLSVSIRHSRNKKRSWRIPVVLFEYGICTLIDVWVTMVIVTYGFRVPGVSIDALDRFSFFTKYTAIAILVALLIPYIEELIKKYIEITVTVRTENEKG